MTLKEEFLKISKLEEFRNSGKRFKNLDLTDKDIRNHFDELYGVAENSGYINGVIYEAYKNEQ